jgi:hypothetical protein
MITPQDIARLAAFLSNRLVEESVELLASGKKIEELSPEESEAVVAVLLAALGALQSYIISALPPAHASNVRAYLDRLSTDIQRARNTPTPTERTPDA